ncbi:MAG: type II secretion system protein [bacterium]
MNILMMKILWLFAIKNAQARLAKETNIFRKGFTLAEVLITLTLVGIVAAVTMVTLIPNIQNAQYKTEFKDVYSVLTQVTSQIAADNGNSLKNVFTDNNDLRNKYKEYLNFIKSCDSGQTNGNCWHNNGSLKYLNGSPITTWGNPAGIILNNGSLLRLTIESSNCTALSGTLQYCGFIYFDVNGFKGPNTLGKDMYGIWIQENGIKPMGTKGDGLDSSCISLGGGQGCAAKVLMGEDY